MKTAISVDDALMAQADETARELGVSRSRLICEALREYLKKRRQARITEQLNRAYAKEPSPEERELVRRFKTKFPIRDRW